MKILVRISIALQEVLRLRELGFPFKVITRLINASDYVQLEALKCIEPCLKMTGNDGRVIGGIYGIKDIEEGAMMKKEHMFKGINFRKNPHEEEARERWGNEKVNQAKYAIEEKNEEEIHRLENRINNIFQRFSELVGSDPGSDEAVSLVREFHQLLNQEVGGFYDKVVFKGLGELYVSDQRFAESLNRWGNGTAQFMNESMARYSDLFL